MNFEAWGKGDSEPGRVKRLAVGYVAGIGVCAAVAFVGATFSGTARSAEEEDVVDVKLAATVEPTPAAPPPPPPPQQTKAPSAAAPGPRKKQLSVPTTIPTDAPPEGDPSRAKAGDGDDAYGDGPSGGGGTPGGTGTAPAPAHEAPPPPPPPPPPPKRQGPIQLPENATPPEPISNAAPSYPAEARSQGVEATVVVKFVVTETGEVTSVTIVRGHPMFDAAVLSAVKSWRYKPAVYEGRPIQVFKVARIPFKLKT